MNALDYIFIALVLVGLIVGIIKGLLKQLLALLGVVVVSTLTATVQPYVQNWFVNTSMSDGTRNVVALLVTVVLLSVVYILLALLVRKLLTRAKIVKALDRILGGVVGVASVYFSFAVVLALLTNTSESFLPKIKAFADQYISDSWIVTHIYKHNFFGDWVVNGIAQRLIENLQPTKPETEALAIAVSQII